MPDAQISEEMCLRAAVGKRKRQMERTGAGNAFDPTCPPTDNEMDDARAALEAALSGHVVVPREPTQAMLLAAFKEANEQLLRTDGNAHCKSDEERSAHAIAPVYRAMIQAAPPVPEMEPNPTAGAS